MKKFLIVIVLTLVSIVQAMSQVSFSEALQKARAGEVRYQCAVGYCYETGNGTSKDTALAVYWYQQAAQQEDSVGQYMLGNCYLYGIGVKQDMAQAVLLTSQSAAKGYALAQYRLGVMYYAGEGLTQDYQQALFWFTQAASAGNKNAQIVLAEMYYNGKGTEKNDEKALYWYLQLAQDDTTPTHMRGPAQYLCGSIYKDHNYLKEAVFWLQKAAELGYAEAQVKLARMYAEGDGVEQNTGLMLSWYIKAAKQGNKTAQQALGVIYSTGLYGAPKDIDEAEYWFEQAEH